MTEYSEYLLAVSREAFTSEDACIERLKQEALWFHEHSELITDTARRYVQRLRKTGKKSAFETFEEEYGLTSAEGILMMCLAEALLRIPDKATADALIQDKLGSGDWDKHLGLGRPLLLNAGTLGLEMAGRIMHETHQTAGQFVHRLVRRLGEPLVRSALRSGMWHMGSVFVMGNSIEEALKHSQKRRRGLTYSFDMLGEGARSDAQAEAYFSGYLHAMQSLPEGEAMYAKDGVSVKLSALHPRLELRKRDMLRTELLPRLHALVEAARARSIMLTIDAEEATRLDITLELFTEIFTRQPYAGLGLAVQAYQKRAPHVIKYLAMLAKKHGQRIPVRLVKGAYWDGEIKRAQVDGLEDYPVFTCKAHTDISYLACARLLMENGKYLYPQFATHNARSIASIVQYARMHGITDFEFQRLHGMGEALYETIADVAPRLRVYAPVGRPEQLLSYLIRRILENGANNSFVRGQYSAPLEELIRDSFAVTPEKDPSIPLPKNLYAPRINSPGFDLGNAYSLKKLDESFTHFLPPSQDIPKVAPEQAIQIAQQGFEEWRRVEVEKRACILEKAAELFLLHQQELMHIAMEEAGKTIADAIAEVREAVDYCRYYAMEARRILRPQLLPGVSGERNILSLHPRGIVTCISPWNFPLAIFIGQVAAALAAGNSVLAKPAEETPHMAALAVRLLHEAGIPYNALQLVPGPGETVGRALTQNARIAGLVFTGGTDTARSINQALAEKAGPIVPFIAETGGQNCMIIDSSALLEQAVDDVIASAFGSAGQRCSSLRVVFVQQDIMQGFKTLLTGAMHKLVVGRAGDVATDIGPVISAPAYRMLKSHVDAMSHKGRLIAVAPLPDNAAERLLFAPHAFEIPSIDILPGEIFGPVVHVIAYRAGELDKVVDHINATGFALTFGMHSRIDASIHQVCARVRAGNIYINRSIIGAVVGSQPFGGFGLSGTGPKAGGPHYLTRLCAERTETVNTAAIGGNIELLIK